MKHLIALIAVLSFAVTAFGQSAGIYTIGPFNGGTNVVAAESTNTTGFTIACSDFDYAGVQLSCKATAATTGNVYVRVYRSADGTTYETTPSDTITLVQAGTGTVTEWAGLTLGGVGTLKFVGPENTNATAILTNISMKIRYTAPRTK